MATLRDYIARIEELEGEKKDISEQISEVYEEAKGSGYDTKIMKAVVKRRKLTEVERKMADDLLATYEANLAEQFELPIDARRARPEDAKGFKDEVREQIAEAGFEEVEPGHFRARVN